MRRELVINRRMSPLRKTIDGSIYRGDRYFQWRGGDVSRLESLFDAVVALALTLIMVTVEVPDSFADLKSAFQRLPAFGICFAILTMCWYYHYLFHRRYGLEDFPIVILNCVLMFLVVFYVYPLKFLYTFMFARTQVAISADEVVTLMTLYSGGFAAIFACLWAMHLYALSKRTELELTANEVTLTRMKLWELGWYIAVAVGSIGLVLYGLWAPLSGMVYAIIGPIQFANGWWWGKKLVEPASC